MLFQHLSDRRIILGSGSPRRKELLESLGISFEVVISGNEEIEPSEIDPVQIPVHLAKQKASDITSELTGSFLLITADTIVLKDNIIFGKPTSSDNAVNMIMALSDSCHDVITGVCITTTEKQISFKDTTRVHFAPISQQEAQYYVNHYEVMDKAGAYGIQDWIGLSKISKIEGSYYNVMGLPVHRLYGALRHW